MSDIEKLIELLQPGSVVYVGGSCAEPHSLLDAIGEQGGSLAGIHYIQQPLGAVNSRDLSLLTPESTQRVFFMTADLQEGLKAGRVEFVPMHMRAIFDYLSRIRIDVALLQGARDREGRLRFGPNVDYVDAVLSSCKTLVIEENGSYTAPMGAPAIDEARIDLVIQSNSVKPTYPVAKLDETSEKIGSLIADLIRDGDCIQTGIGAVPAAILNNLKDRSDLGFHGGLMDDGVMELIANGNITGANKQIDRNQHVLGMALGSDELLDWLARDPKAEQVVFRSANYTHESTVIRQLDNFVSINSAIEIDLMGQVNAEVAGGRQISGTGGSVDFMRAAKMSRGGRSIVAMTSTARRGSVSRIVPTVSVVTALRTDVDIVVTEYGFAELKDESLKSRAERLIAIAHPDFRDELRTSVS
ncbi:MAG: acetyl-CoA hydrolase/transferase family protein [Gammaproteobacteria bacterium]|jgi:4-hydroxybutyrate CoA-transferase|nr:acetyl-CoA hydrolase/transferase family protein [Gammaproteobacteria bacterium]MBT4492825.1 acetyl-CoA hydrolase/transferase family protein [Gammaproteobacteria bacterium]MBT7369025.1 acetyl-CoA hydrolase/transferase family protein [Gammaproteobacteria bacterium]